jgi:hypothetical protein
VPDDVDALADALVMFLEDPTRRREVGSANRRFVLEQHELGAQCRAMGEAFASREP